MRKVGTVALAAALMGFVVGGSSDASARTRFVRLPARGAVPGFVPFSRSASQPVLATVRLAGDPLTPGADAAAQARLDAEQQAVAARLEQLGGTVLYSLDQVANALVVRIDPNLLAQVAATPGVAAVRQSRQLERDNTIVNAYTGASTVWQALGVTGRGVKIAIIDDGVDYYHADFGGSGRAADTANDDGLTIGTSAFPNAKLAGGYDFVGNTYDAASGDPARRVPHPDPDPLACGTHGTHVAGTAAGYGVTSAGATYRGPYDPASVAALALGPGAAPEATIYAYKVFGCDGATDDAVVAAAIDRAIADHVDVISLSLGAPYGNDDSIDAQAVQRAVAAGITVVAAAGNDGPNAYLVDSPGTADGAISVGALDASFTEFPAATIGVVPAASAVVANDKTFTTVVGPVRIAGAAAGTATTIGLGCSTADYAGVRPGDIVVVKRGDCTRADKARLAAAAGAAAVVLVNTQAGLPPFEGAISGVDVPFLGTLSSTGPALLAAQGSPITIARVAPIANAGYGQMATFSAGGPRNGDSGVKPDLAAPGVSVFSASAGTGTGGQRESGTSMAVPHVAGLAALLHEARPSWNPAAVKAALMNTADGTAARIKNINMRIAGVGVVDAVRALSTSAVATTADGTNALAFGYRPSRAGISATRTFSIRNTGAAPLTYDLAPAFNGGTGADRGADVVIDPAVVTVPAGASVELAVTLDMSASAVSKLPDASQPAGQVVLVRGTVSATPREAGAVPLRMPFSLVPRGLSDVRAEAAGPLAVTATTATGTVTLSNRGIHRGTADVYAWLLADSAEGDTPASAADLRSLGVQTYPGALLGSTLPDDQAIVFAVNVEGRWSTASTVEVDLPIDVDGDGAYDYTIVGADFGAVMNGSDNGQFAAFTFDRTGRVVDAYIADAPMNGSTLLLPTLASNLGLTPASAPIAVRAQAVDRLTRVVDVLPGIGRWQPFHPAVSNADLIDLTATSSAPLPVSVSLADQAAQRVLGWLVVTLDDRNGGEQADRVALAPLLPA